MDLRGGLRRIVALLLYQTGLTAPARRGRGRLTVVTFHRVLPEAQRRTYPFPNLAVSPEELDSLLAFLTSRYDCGTLANQHARFVAGEAAARPLLALTFDDGQYDNFLYARPLLSRYGVRATFFVPVAAVQSGGLLWHDRAGFAVLELAARGEEGRAFLRRTLGIAATAGMEPRALARSAARALKLLARDARLERVRELAAAAGDRAPPEYARVMALPEVRQLSSEGHEIGSHSMTHCMMTECDDCALHYEVGESRTLLSAELQRPVESFCYPNGDCDDRAAAAVAAAGYARAVTTQHGVNDRGENPFRLRRIDMDPYRLGGTGGTVLPAAVAYRVSGLQLKHGGLQ